MSTDNKPTVQQAAKQGNPQAIAILLNRQLQPKGITAKVSVKDSCLQIMLEAANVPNQKGLVAAIQKWIDGLGVDSIQRVQIYAKQTGEDIPAWNDSFEIVRQLEEPKIADTVISPMAPTETVKNDVKVEATNTSKLDPALLELAKNGDTKAIAELIKNSLQQTDIKVRATLNKGLLQVVLVSSQLPKQDSSVEAIPKLVQDWESTLIEKLKVVGMQEIDGSNNSKMIWTQDYELKSNYFNQSEISNNRNTLIKLANNGDMSAISKLCYLELCYLEFTQDDLNISSPKIDIITRMDDGNVLRINIRCHEKIEQNIVVNSIYKAIVDLDFNNITNIMISIYAFSNMNPTWMREFTSIQLLQKFCDSKSNNQQYNLPISSDNDSNSVAKRSSPQTDQSIQTDNTKNNNIALIISIIFGGFGGLILIYGLLNYFGFFRPSRYDTDPVAELSQIKSLLIIFLPLFLWFFALQIELLARLRK